ncbi:MAG: protein rep [Myxococcota bacterium]|nr:protein rep [Myxococcota bacterium]
MKSWLARVAELTLEHRAERADRLMALGRNRVRRRREEGYSETYAQDDARWHRVRARAQLERPERAEDCGSEVLSISCAGCGQVHERRAGCRLTLLCVPCRRVIAAEKRSSFVRARGVVVQDAERRGLLRPHRRGGRWSEKLLTLTAWHDLPLVAQRIGRILAAWPLFLRRLTDFWRAHDVKSAAWLRVFEWTPGKDGYGHPHLHVWIFAPFLERDLLEQWWREALLECSATAPVTKVIVDIREVDATGAEYELIKYLTKDITADGTKLAPELFAEVYRALDGHRSTQGSRGFMGLAEKEGSRCDCGCALPKRVRRVRQEQPQNEREQ